MDTTQHKYESEEMELLKNAAYTYNEEADKLAQQPAYQPDKQPKFSNNGLRKMGVRKPLTNRFASSLKIKQ